MYKMVIIATATEMQNHFGKYMRAVMKGDTVIVTRNGKEIGRFIPKKSIPSFLTDSLIGVLSTSDEVVYENKATFNDK